MWQFQWMINLIPDAVLSWIYWGVIAAGLTGLFAGWLGRFIPFYGKYMSILKPVGILLLVLGVWLRGGYDTEMAWRARVADLEAKLKEAEAQSQQVNNVVQERVVEKTKIIKGKTEYITQYLDREVIKKEEIIKYIEQCPVPKEIIDLHNQAAEINKAAEGFKK